MSTILDTLLNAVAAAGAGPEVVVSTDPDYFGGDHTVEVSGTFVGTAVFQGRIDTVWKTFASFTGADILNVPGCFAAIRGNVTAYTSGSITMKARSATYNNLSAAIAAMQAVVSLVQGDTTTLVTRLSSARAALLDNLNRLDVQVSTVSAQKSYNDLYKLLREYNKL